MSRVDCTPPSPDPLLGTRLRDASASDSSSANLAALLSLASFDPTPKGAQPWARIEDNLSARMRPNTRLRWLWPSIALTSMVIATGAIAGPILVRWVGRTPQVQTRSAVSLPTPIPLKERTFPVKPAVHAVKAKPRMLAMAQPAKAAPPLPSALAEESKLLGTALASLRKDKDATRTLALLDDYQAKFPKGELASEAERTRVEAYLLQRRSPEALAVLDRMTFALRARDNEWRVLRGEFRARAHRCGQAQDDFSGALKVNENGPIAERALYGRASCLLELKDAAGAQAALLEYVARFPSGAHAVQVRKALDASAP